MKINRNFSDNSSCVCFCLYVFISITVIIFKISHFACTGVNIKVMKGQVEEKVISILLCKDTILSKKRAVFYGYLYFCMIYAINVI